MTKYSQNREILKNRKVSKAVCEVEGCSKKAMYGERSEVHGCVEPERCKGHKDNFTHFTQCKWTFEYLLKTVTFVGAVMTRPDTVEAWAFDKVNQKTKISLTCPVHDRQYEQTLAGLTTGKHGCGECNRNVPWSQRVPELLDYITGQGYTLDEPLEDLERGLDEKGNNYKLKLICPEGHPYYSGTVATFTGKQQHRCFTCNGTVPWSERVPELLDYITGQGYTLDEPLEDLERGLEKEGCDYKLKLICSEGHAYYSGTVDSFTGTRQRGCSTCAGNVPWSKRVPELLDIIAGRKYTLDEPLEDLERGLDKEGKNYKLKLRCPEGHAYYSGPVDHFTGRQQGCRTCAGTVPWSERVPELLDYITGQGYTLDEPLEDLERGLDKKGNNYKLKLRCPEGHPYYSGTVTTFTGKQQHRCFTCNGTVPWSERVPELLDIITGRNYTLDEPLEDLKRRLKKDKKKCKLKLRCPNGHKYYSGTVDKFTGTCQRGCSTCTDPKTEKLVREWLEEQFSNKFEKKAHPDFLFYPETGRKLELDLFCTEQKLAFEIDGIQHNEYQPKYFHRIREKEDNTFDNTNPWHSHQIYPGEPQNDRLFIHQQKKDRFIDKRCEEEGIYLIRVDRRYYNHENPEKLIAYLEEQIKKFMEVRGYVYKYEEA